jgi:hypothetical protein
MNNERIKDTTEKLQELHKKLHDYFFTEIDKLLKEHKTIVNESKTLDDINFDFRGLENSIYLRIGCHDFSELNVNNFFDDFINKEKKLERFSIIDKKLSQLKSITFIDMKRDTSPFISDFISNEYKNSSLIYALQPFTGSFIEFAIHLKLDKQD